MKDHSTIFNETAQEWCDSYDARRKPLAATNKLFYAFCCRMEWPRTQHYGGAQKSSAGVARIWK
jgi:hypothetical protein